MPTFYFGHIQGRKKGAFVGQVCTLKLKNLEIWKLRIPWHLSFCEHLRMCVPSSHVGGVSYKDKISIILRKSNSIFVPIAYDVLSMLYPVCSPYSGWAQLHFLVEETESWRGQVACTRGLGLLRRKNEWLNPKLSPNWETALHLHIKTNKINRDSLFCLWIQMTVTFCPRKLSNIKWLLPSPRTLKMNHKWLQQNWSLLSPKYFISCWRLLISWYAYPAWLMAWFLISKLVKQSSSWQEIFLGLRGLAYAQTGPCMNFPSM